jgi:hypothetical protein
MPLDGAVLQEPHPGRVAAAYLPRCQVWSLQSDFALPSETIEPDWAESEQS